MANVNNTNIYDVAAAAKVSLATVSRVMNKPEKVNPETRERVLRVIKELGYRPNAIARGLASRKSTTVGIVMSDVSRASTSQLLGGIIDIAKQYSYAIKIFSMLEDEDPNDVVRTVIAEQVDGILFLNDELEHETLNTVISAIQEAQIPLVLCNVIHDDLNVPMVSIDYEKAVYDITTNLIKQGKKQIYFVSTVRRYSVNASKLKGYEKAMAENNLPPLVFRTSGDVAINKLHFEEFLKNNKIEAAISVRDSIAVSLMNIAIKQGLRVPEDLVVIGLQNTKYALLSRPTLTCLDTPVYDIGAVSMRLLTKYMLEENVEDNHIILPYSLVTRETN